MHTQTELPTTAEALAETPSADHGFVATREIPRGVEYVRTSHQVLWLVSRSDYNANPEAIESSGVSFQVVDDLWA